MINELIEVASNSFQIKELTIEVSKRVLIIYMTALWWLVLWWTVTWLTYKLTQWNWVLLKKLIVLQLIKKFTTFCGTWRFIAVLQIWPFMVKTTLKLCIIDSVWINYSFCVLDCYATARASQKCVLVPVCILARSAVSHEWKWPWHEDHWWVKKVSHIEHNTCASHILKFSWTWSWAYDLTSCHIFNPLICGLLILVIYKFN